MKLNEIKLLEKATGAQPEFTNIDDKEHLKVLQSKCKDGLALALEGRRFFRSDEGFRVVQPLGMSIVDPSKTERKSQNTTNQYTSILDNHPEMKDWPKRSRSYIASTSRNQASDFKGSEFTYMLIPFDGVKIGFVNEPDLWETQIKIFRQEMDIQVANNYFNELKLNTYDDIKEFSKDLKDGNKYAINSLRKVLTIMLPSEKEIEPYVSSFLGQIEKAYSPSALGFTKGTTSDLLSVTWNKNTEVWIGGPCAVINDTYFDKLVKTL